MAPRIGLGLLDQQLVSADKAPKARARKKQGQGQGQDTFSGGRASSTAGPAQISEPLSDERIKQLDDELQRIATNLGCIPECFFNLSVGKFLSGERLGRSLDAVVRLEA